MSNMNNLELIDKVTKMTVKSRGKSKVAIELFEKGKCVRISNHIKLLKDTDYIVYQPPLGFKKGIQKERWEIKGLVLKNRTNYCKIQIIENSSSNQELKKDSIWRVSKDALKKVD